MTYPHTRRRGERRVTTPMGKPRGFYGLAPMLCRPTATMVDVVQHRRGGIRCSCLANEHCVQETFVLLPVGTVYHGTPETRFSWQRARRQCNTYSAPAGEGPFILSPQRWGLLAQER